MSYIKIFLIFTWFFFCCFLGIFITIARFGNAANNSLLIGMFSWGARLVSGVKVEDLGKENLPDEEPVIYVGNHQSGFDMVTFGAVGMKKIIAIGKKELLYVPLFGLLLWANGSVLLDREKQRKALNQLDEAVERIKKKRFSTLIFPEGTRNKSTGGFLNFKKGAFLLAIKAGVDIVPVVCSSIQHLVSSEQKMLKPGTLTVQVLPPVSTTGYHESNVKELADKVKELMQEAYEKMPVA